MLNDIIFFLYNKRLLRIRYYSVAIKLKLCFIFSEVSLDCFTEPASIKMLKVQDKLFFHNKNLLKTFLSPILRINSTFYKSNST